MRLSVLRSQISKSWWKDRRDNPVFLSQLESIQRSVATALEREDIAWQPRLAGSLPAAGDHSPILFAACDEGYFYRFGRQLAISAALRSPGSRVHLHIYGPSPLCLADAEFLQRRPGARLTVSHEAAERNPYGAPSRFFYAAGRFAVSAALMARCAAPVMTIDVDSIVRGDLDPALAPLCGACDLALVRRPGRPKPWRQALASAVLVTPGGAGRQFLTQLAGAIHLALATRPAYHVDQTALAYLLAAYEQRRTPIRIAQLGPDWADHDFAPDSVIWSAKGGRKHQFTHLSHDQARAVILG